MSSQLSDPAPVATNATVTRSLELPETEPGGSPSMTGVEVELHLADGTVARYRLAAAAAAVLSTCTHPPALP